MRMSRRSVLAGLLLLGGSGLATAADQAVERMMAFKPAQKGVAYTTPVAAELDKCKVESARTADGKGTVWVLKDGKGSVLRRFIDTNGDKYPDQWSVYKDGIEVYREVDSNFNGKTDRYVWLNSGGMRVGIDKQENGIIESWQALSVEELSQEVLKALTTKDYKTLEAVLVTEEDLKTIGAPASEIKRIKELQSRAQAKFSQTATKLSHLNEKTNWLHVETGAPSRLPADTTAMKQDVLMHYRGLIFCETGGKSDFIQLGEMVLIGDAWKLIDVPLPGDADAGVRQSALMNGNAKTEGPSQEFLEKLAELDKTAPSYGGGVGPNAAVAAFQLKRAALIEEFVAKAPAGERDHWTKQLIDSLGTAFQASGADAKALDKLKALTTQLAKDRAGSDVAAYAAYRELTCEYTKAVQEAKGAKQMMDVQNQHLERLGKFVATYPKAEDGADALLQLGMINEFQGKEADAKKWYEQMTKQYQSSPQALKGAGAIRRIGLEGKVWELGAQANTLAGTPAFNPAVLRGKITVVYYWATWCQTAQADLAKLKQLAQENRSNGLQIVCVNVDDNQATAEAFVKQNGAVGYHLYATGGLESPLATHYGLVVFPNTFLVGKDGKVIDRSIDVDGLGDAIKKALK